jgi:glycosyltransferase involved in cell wall biosynthesis
VSRPARVLQIVQNLNYGGMERLIVELVARLEPTQFESHVLVLGGVGRFGEDLSIRVPLHRLPPLSKFSMLWPSGLIAALRRLRPDIVHSHSGVWYKASLAARRAGIPVVIHTDHGRPDPDPLPRRLLERTAARRTDVVVAVSAPLERRLRDTVVRGAAPVELIVNGVDTAHHRPAADDGAARRELGLAPDVPILGSIGRLQPIKGYDVMLAAYARFRAGWRSPGPTPVLVVGGDGPDRERLQALARAERLDGVFLLGWRDDVEAFHASFTLFTMASRSEGTSVSLLEAMSAGLCPVVTDVGGNRDVLGPELRHRLVRSEDPAALAAAWAGALADSEARNRDARAARRRVEQEFSLDAMVRGYERLYRRLLNRN